jgi:hypothetical protein
MYLLVLIPFLLAYWKLNKLTETMSNDTIMKWKIFLILYQLA